MMRHRWMLIVLAAFSCTDFDRVDRNVCGNAIVEPDLLEDCDGAPLNADEISYPCGEPGTAHQCRVLCNGNGRACPDGWACNPDTRVCHESLTDTFAISEPVRVTRLRRIATTDVDGDGVGDLLTNSDPGDDGVGRLGIFHFDGEGTVETAIENEVATRATAPIVVGPLGDVPRPATANVSVLLTAPDAPGFMPLRGSATRTLTAGLTARYTGFGNDIILLGAVQQSESGQFGYLPAIGENHGMILAGGVLDATHDVQFNLGVFLSLDPKLDGAFPSRLTSVAEIAPIAGPHIEFVALAVPGADHARQYFNPEFSERGWPHAEIALPEGITVAVGGGVVHGDVDGDGFLDLLIHGNDGNTYLSYNRGFGEYASSPDVFPPDSATSETPVIIGAHPIAVGFIDDDDIADFVFPRDHGIALSHADPIFGFIGSSRCPEMSAELPGNYACDLHGGPFGGEFPRWSQVAIADVNADGITDVVAASDEANRIDVFYLNEFNLTAPHRITTPGRVRGFDLADTNFDLVEDVLFHVTVEGRDQLLVSHGRRDTGPDEPELLFEAPTILDVDAQAGGGFVAWRDEHERAFVGAFGGDPTSGRAVSYSQIPCPDDVPAQPVQVAMGNFDENTGYDAVLLYRDCFVPVGGGAVDLLVLHPGGAYGTVAPAFDTLWDTSVCGLELTLTCPQIRDALHPVAVELDATTSWSRDALLIPIDLDPDAETPRQEIVLLSPSGDDTSELAVAALDPEPPRLARFRIRSRATVAASIGGNYEAVGVSRGKAETTDVDADGDDDIVLLTTDASPRLVVFESRDGKLIADFTTLTFAGAPDAPVTAFAVVDADYDLTRDDLVIAAGGDVFIITDAFEEGATAVRISVPGLIDLENPAIDDLVTADFNGDGLTDIAVAIDDDVRILLGVPANP